MFIINSWFNQFFIFVFPSSLVSQNFLVHTYNETGSLHSESSYFKVRPRCLRHLLLHVSLLKWTYYYHWDMFVPCWQFHTILFHIPCMIEMKSRPREQSWAPRRYKVKRVVKYLFSLKSNFSKSVWYTILLFSTVLMFWIFIMFANTLLCINNLFICHSVLFFRCIAITKDTLQIFQIQSWHSASVLDSGNSILEAIYTWKLRIYFKMKLSGRKTQIWDI